MINLHESMGPGRDRIYNPWICSQTRICCQTRYRLRYAARFFPQMDLNLELELLMDYASQTVDLEPYP